MPLAKDWRIAVFGATGVVGQELLGMLAAEGVGVARVAAFASEASLGRELPFGEEASLVVATGRPEAPPEADLAFLALDPDPARLWAPLLSARGTRVIDLSSAHRFAEGVPLVVPEANAEELAAQAEQLGLIIANPNCSTILMVTVLAPLIRRFGLERVAVSTYQAVSGAGAAAMEELCEQTRAVLDGEAPQARVLPEPCAFNVFPHESALEEETGLNGEERKLIEETRRILGRPHLAVVPNCVRVPVLRTHAQSLEVALEKPAFRGELLQLLDSAPGVELRADAPGSWPTSLRAAYGDSVLVGRVRPAPDEEPDAQGRHRRWLLWLAGDQLRKGAAGNAIQIADLLAAAAAEDRGG